MKYLKRIIYFLSLIILTLGVNASWGAEREEKKIGDVKTSKSSGDLSRSAAELTVPGPVGPGMAATTSTPNGQQIDTISLLLQKVAALETGYQTQLALNTRIQEAHQKEMEELYKHIGSIIHNKPPVYKELIPTNRLLWLALCYGLYRGITNVMVFYAQTGSYYYAFNMGVEGFLNGAVTAYYVCSLLAILGTYTRNIPGPASSAKKKTD